MKRFILILFALLSLSATALQAQDTPKVKTIPVESQAINVQLSPDGHTLAVYNNFQVYNEAALPELVPVTFYDANTGEVIGSLDSFADWVTGLSFNSDGSQLVTFHRNGDLNLWNVADLSLIKTIPTYTYGGSTVQFAADDHTVLYRTGQFVLGLLDLDTGAITHLFGEHMDTFDQFATNYIQFPGQGDILLAAAELSPDGHWLAVSTANDAVYLWDVASGERFQLRDASEKVAQFSIRAFAFSGDSGQLIYFDGDDSRTHVWNVSDRSEAPALDFGGSAFTITPDAGKLAWIDKDSKTVYLADLATGSAPVELFTLPDGTRIIPAVTSLAFTADQSELVVGGLYGSDEVSNIYLIHLAS